MTKVDITDNALLDGFRHRDPKAIEQLHGRYYHQLYFFAKTITGTHMDSQDVVADAFFKLIENLEKINDLEHARNSLFLFTKQLAINLLRRKEVATLNREQLIYLSENGEDYLDQQRIIAKRLDILFEKIEELPPQVREVIKHVLSNKTNTEIATTMGIAVNTVKNHKSRAIHLLRLALPTDDLLLASFLLMLITERGLYN